MADVLRLYEGETLGIRLFVRARRLLAPLERVAASVPPTGNVLDLGCGHGLFSLRLALASPDRRVLGVDPSSVKLEVARRASQGLPNLEFRLGTVDEVEKQSFQVITLLDVLYLLPVEEKLHILRRCRQLLAPDGLLLIKANDIHPGWKYAVAWLQEWGMTTVGLTLGHGNLYFLSCEANRSLLQQAGFDVQVLHLSHWTPYPHALFLARPRPEASGTP